MPAYTAQPRQSLLDVAIAATGSMEAAYDIALDNSLPLTTVFSVAIPLQVPAAEHTSRLPERDPCTGVDPPHPQQQGGSQTNTPGAIGQAIIGQAVIQ